MTSVDKATPAVTATTHKLHVQQPFFNLIKTGEKIFEIRTGDHEKRKIREGDKISFYWDLENPAETCTCIVKEIIEASSFRQMLETVGIGNALPGSTDITDGVKIYHSIPGYLEKEKLGVLGFRLEIVSSVIQN